MEEDIHLFKMFIAPFHYIHYKLYILFLGYAIDLKDFLTSSFWDHLRIIKKFIALFICHGEVSEVG